MFLSILSKSGSPRPQLPGCTVCTTAAAAGKLAWMRSARQGQEQGSWGAGESGYFWSTPEYSHSQKSTQSSVRQLALFALKVHTLYYCDVLLVQIFCLKCPERKREIQNIENKSVAKVENR